jgi:23S rRNA (guanine2535-N1)-methyltransferase
MEYRYAPDRDDTDLASGHVLRSAPGQPAFPVRLGVELLHRALAHLPATSRPATLWDPVCGAAQLATTLGLRARRELAAVVATDVDPVALGLARRNIALLTVDGLEDRRRELSQMATTHGTTSHRDAAEAAARLRDELAAGGGDLVAHAEQADVLDPVAVQSLVAAWAPDVVVADLPHGELTSWHGAPPDVAVARLLTTLAGQLAPSSVLVVVARARRIRLPESVTAIERLRVGHRAAAIVHAGSIADRT